jgi:hypothetical protein
MQDGEEKIKQLEEEKKGVNTKMQEQWGEEYLADGMGLLERSTRK